MFVWEPFDWISLRRYHMRPRSIELAVVCLLVLPIRPDTARAGAWTQSAGQSYLRESVSFYSADQYYDSDGVAHDGDWSYPSSEFGNTQFVHIAEYGYRDDLSLAMELVYKSIAVDRAEGIPNQRLSGFGDLKLGLKKRLATDPVIFSVLAQIEIPTGYDSDLSQVELDQGRFYMLGSGEYNGEFRLLAGDGFRLGSVPGYYNLEAGYRLRGGAYANDVTYSAAVGLRPLGRLWLRAGFSGVEHLGESSDMETMGQTYNSASYTSLGAAATIVVTRGLSIEFGYSSEVEGRDTLKGRAFEIALELRRR